MAQIIQHNIQSLNSYNRLSTNNTLLSKNLEKLSSGYKINRAGDDAAGLAISQKMRAQITGLERASANAQDGISLVQTAEGALTEVHSMLNRMVELATQSSNGTYDNTDRANLQKEVESLKNEIDRISNETNFNGIKLLDGSMGGGSSTAGGAVFMGSKVASSQAAKLTTAAINKATMKDMDATSAAGATKDFLRIDGQDVTIDWANNAEAKELLGQLDADLSAATDEALKGIAAKFEEVINNAAKDQGVDASVSVSFDTTAKTLSFKSNNKGVDSEFSYLGNDATSADNAKKGVFNTVINGTAANDSKANINEATKNYDGDTIANGKVFNMTINGVTVEVKVDGTATGADYTKGTTMSTVAGDLQTDIRTAITAYNNALGLTAGTEDTESGLTGLTANDFTVTEEDGAFKIEYTGDEDVVFSFSDVGDRDFAAQLGLTGGSSAAGGTGGLSLQIGDTASQRISVSINDMDSNSLGVGSIDIGTETGATASIDKIKNAINKVSSTRADLGAIQNRLEYTINNLATTTENLTSAESRIRDTDMAKEMMAYTKNNVLSQAAQAMLAQANQQPQQILQLLQ